MIAWHSGPRCKNSSAAPTVATTPIREPASVPQNQANPVSARRGPTPLCGRRDQPTRPHPISVHPTVRSAAVAARLCPERASHSAPRPTTSPAGHPACRSRTAEPRRLSRNQRSKPIPRQLALGDEPAHRAPGQPPPVGGNTPGGYEHHRWRITRPSQAFGNLEPVDVRQLDIKQHDAGTKQSDRGERRRAITRLADHVEAL